MSDSEHIPASPSPQTPIWRPDRVFPHDIPDNLKEMLLVGSVGTLHRTAMAGAALGWSTNGSHRGPRLALDMLSAAWEADPLNLVAAHHTVKLADQLGLSDAPLPAVLRELLARVKDEKPHDASFRRRPADEQLEMLLAELSRNIFLPRSLDLAIRLAIAMGCKNRVLTLLSKPWPPVLQPVRLLLLGRMHHFTGDPETASLHYRVADEYLEAAEAEASLAMCLYELGHKDEAVSRLTSVLRRRPWHVNVRLTLYDLIHRIHARKGCIPDSLAVLLYTFNKSGELDATLKRVFDSELIGAKVHVLDNGSSDRTGNVCAAWLRRVGPERLAVHRLPTNIGAPAARNWLLALDEVRTCEFVAFLDDDAQPPRDWIRRLVTAQELYPEAGAWGCRVHDAGLTPFTQSVDLQPRPPYGTPADHPEVSDLHLQGLDPGYFKYVRPALSVTGCCHMFPRKSFDIVGGFDLRYSPSQLDDLDLDLRLAERETPPVYQGHLGVGHLKRTGVLSESDSRTAANSRGNQEKLHGKYAGERWHTIRRKMLSILHMDLEEKSRYLEGLLKP